MKKTGWLALTVVGASFLLLILGSQAQAWTQFRSGKSGTVSSNETVDNTVFLGARDVDIAGTVNADLFCGAQTVNISGTVKGDVICAAQTISINGMVEGSVRLAAQTVNLTGTIGRSATIAAQTINSDSKSRIGMDASLAGTDLNLNGSIGRDLATTGDNLTIGGQVKRDVKSGTNKIVLIRSAKIGGGIEYTSREKITINGATITGKVTHKQPKENKPWLRLLVFANFVAVIAAILLLITALIATALLPRFVHSVSTQAIRRPWWTLLTGFVAGIVVPIVFVLLLLTVVGIPLAILLLLVWLLIAATSGWFAAYYLGRRIWRRQNNALLRVLAGGVVLLILSLIPYLGFFVMLAAFWMGVGMAVLELKSRGKSLGSLISSSS